MNSTEIRKLARKSQIKSIKNSRVFFVKAGILTNTNNKIDGVYYINFASYPGKIEIDLDILGELAYDYLAQIAYNLEMSVDEIKDLLSNWDYKQTFQYNKKIAELEKNISILKERLVRLEERKADTVESVKHSLDLYKEELASLLENKDDFRHEPILFRISIPIVREHLGCNCGHIFVKREDFYKGILKFNDNFGQFYINLMPEHRVFMDEFYDKFIELAENIDMNDYRFQKWCPALKETADFSSNFCISCIQAKKTTKLKKFKNRMKKLKKKFAKKERNKKLMLKVCELKAIELRKVEMKNEL